MKALIIAAITGIVALCLLLLLIVAAIKIFFAVLSFVLVIIALFNSLVGCHMMIPCIYKTIYMKRITRGTAI